MAALAESITKRLVEFIANILGLASPFLVASEATQSSMELAIRTSQDTMQTTQAFACRLTWAAQEAVPSSMAPTAKFGPPNFQTTQEDIAQERNQAEITTSKSSIHGHWAKLGEAIEDLAQIVFLNSYFQPLASRRKDLSCL